MPRDDIIIAQITDVGRLREENQDVADFYEPEAEEDFERHGRLLVVADGVGGHPGGDTAAKTAVSTILEVYSKSDGTDPMAVLRAAFGLANREIFRMGHDRKSLFGMGTTCTALVMRDSKGYLAHVGDSRAYLLRNGSLRQLTKDHSAAWRLLEEGKITKEEYEKHPKSRIIRRSLGFRDKVQVDVTARPLKIQSGDTFMLCSDGLTGVVPESDIAEVISNHPPQEACKLLVEMANQKGGPDNITIQIAQVQSASEKSE